MEKYNVIVHDPTAEVMKIKVTAEIPEFCDVIGTDLNIVEANKKIFEWNEKRKEFEELDQERIKIFNEWKKLSGIIKLNLETTGASILQNPYSIKQNMIDDWKSRVKIQHSHLNFLIKRLWKLSNNYLDKVKV